MVKKNETYCNDKPKVVIRSQKSKAEDLVSIKIAMSNHRNLHPPPPPGKVSKKQVEAIYKHVLLPQNKVPAPEF